MGRPRQHLHRSALGRRQRLSKWLGRLAGLGLQPEIVVLEICSSEPELNEAERRWIFQARMGGADLVNGTDGVKRRIDPLRGRAQDPEHVAKRIAAGLRTRAAKKSQGD